MTQGATTWGSVEETQFPRLKFAVSFLQAGECQKRDPSSASDDDSCEKAELNTQQAFVFGQNLRDRVKVNSCLLPWLAVRGLK